MMIPGIKVQSLPLIKQELNQSRSAANKITDDGSHMSALMVAIAIGNNEIIKLIIDNCTDIDYQSPICGDTALIYAIKLGRYKYSILDIKIEIIKKGANPNLRNHLGQTALHLAILYGDFALAKTLIMAGANIYTKDTSGDSPLDLTKEKFKSRDEFKRSKDIRCLLSEKDLMNTWCSLMDDGVNRNWFENQLILATEIIQQRDSLLKLGVKMVYDKSYKHVRKAMTESNSVFEVLYGLHLQNPQLPLR